MIRFERINLSGVTDSHLTPLYEDNNMSTPFAFPNTVAEFRDALNRGIAAVSGNPVGKSHLLDKAVCAALQVDNIDRLTALANMTPSSDATPYAISLYYGNGGDHYLVINGVYISTELVHNDVLEYTIYERASYLSDLLRIKSEAEMRGESVDYLMANDIDTLSQSNAEWILATYDGAGVLCPHLTPVTFNKVCDAMLSQAKEHYASVVGPLNKGGALLTNAVSYYSGDDIEGLYEGELVLIHRDRLGDESLPVGMTVNPYHKAIPADHIAAYVVGDEYVPVEFD